MKAVPCHSWGCEVSAAAVADRKRCGVLLHHDAGEEVVDLPYQAVLQHRTGRPKQQHPWWRPLVSAVATRVAAADERPRDAERWYDGRDRV